MVAWQKGQMESLSFFVFRPAYTGLFLMTESEAKRGG